MRATRLQNLLATLIIFGILAALGLRVWSGHRAASIYGPKLVAANQNSVYVVMNGHLYHLDRLGAIQDAVSLDVIGFSKTPCDMQALEDGRLLVGNREERTIYACDAGLAECQSLYTLSDVRGRENPGRIADENAFDFYFELTTGRLFIVDAVLREFTIVNMSDGSRTLVLDHEDLALPSDIWVDHRGTARIADTLRQRIAGVVTESSEFKAFYTDYPGRTDVARDGNYFPINLVQGPQNDWWALNAGPRLMKADLIRYDSDGIARQRILLPEDAGPESLAVFGSRLLVADPGHFALFSVDLEKTTVERFGRQPFVDETVYFKDRATNYRNISGLALICLIVLVLLCIFLTWRVYRIGRAGSHSSSVS